MNFIKTAKTKDELLRITNNFEIPPSIQPILTQQIRATTNEKLNKVDQSKNPEAVAKIKETLDNLDSLKMSYSFSGAMIYIKNTLQLLSKVGTGRKT